MSTQPIYNFFRGSGLLLILFVALFSVPRTIQSQNWFQTGQSADLMLSGVDFNQTGGPLQFNHPNGLASDGTNLLVCDRFNNRVLVWKQAPSAWNDAPDFVIGQPDFESNNPGKGKNQLNWPGNAAVAANGVLVIADTDNDRILIWKTFPDSNAPIADLAISLPDITPAGSPQHWGWPWGVWTDGNRLAVVATSGHALLFWDTLPEQDNQPPDYTVDLPEFGTPRNISTDGATYFFTGDHNAKVNGQPGTFFWNSYPSVANQPYDFYRDEWIKGVKLSSGKLIASGLQHIYTWNAVPVNAAQNPDETAAPSFYKNGDGVDVVEAGGKIFVNNYNGNNVLVYENPPTQNSIFPIFALGVSSYHQNSLDSIAYIQNPVPASDGNRLIVSSDFDRKINIFNTIPTNSGTQPDTVISTQIWNLSPWDNALYNNTFVIAGGHGAAVWNNAQALTQSPSQLFNGSIGSAVFSDLRGVALDQHFFYLADRNGKIYLWKGGVPVDHTSNPTYTINLAGVQLSRLSSDGVYFCVAQQSPAAVLIYKTSELLNGNISPWKTISGFGLLNLPSEALPFDGGLAIANQGAHNVLIWKDINQAGDQASAVVLGQPDLNTHWPAIGPNRLFMPGALMALNQDLWVGEFKFSSRILKFSHAAVSATQEADATNKFTMFPNPATNGAHLVFDQHGTYLIRLANVLGQILETTEITDREYFVNLAAYPSGIYFIFCKNQVKTLQKQ